TPTEAGPGGRFRLVRQIRTEGQYEVWAAEMEGIGPLIFRRPLSGMSESASRSLEDSTAIARRIAHVNVVLCHGIADIEGQLAQIEENVHDLDLEKLIVGSKSLAAPIELGLALWIARQLMEAIVHAD